MERVTTLLYCLSSTSAHELIGAPLSEPLPVNAWAAGAGEDIRLEHIPEGSSTRLSQWGDSPGHVIGSTTP